jgi:hypothetical protein
MDRVYQSDVGTTPTPAPFPGAAGFTQSAVAWADFNPTTPGPYFYFYVSESIRAVIVAAGLTPDPTNLQQFYQAIEILAAGGP